MLEGEALHKALASIPTNQERGTAYRLIPAQYYFSALSAIGSLERGGRYNPRGALEALYLSDTPVTALQEVEALLLTGAGLIGLKSSPKTLLSVEYDLERVLDLSQSDTRERLRTTAEELIQPWVLAQTAQTIPPTQTLGVAVAQVGIEAIKAPSAKNLRAHNLVIYPSNLQAGSSLWVYDETGFISARLP